MDMLFIEPSPSPVQSLPDETQPHHLLVSDEKSDIEQHHEAVTKHFFVAVEQGGSMDVTLESQASASSQGSIGSGFILEKSVTSLMLLDRFSSDISHISKGKKHGSQKQSEDYSSVINHECTDTTSRNDMESVSLPPEEYDSTTAVESGDSSKGMKAKISCQFIGESSPSLADAQNNNICVFNEISKNEDIPHLKLNDHHSHNHVQSPIQMKVSESAVIIEHSNKLTENRGFVDTTSPFESVKEAVSKFGGITDWKVHKALAIEKYKHIQQELEKLQGEIPTCKKDYEVAEIAKAEVQKQLHNTKRVAEELKLSLEKGQIEATQAKQDAQLAQLRAKEAESGIAGGASIATKTQLEVVRSRHEATVAELKSVKEELTALKEQHTSLVGQRDISIQRAEEALSTSKDFEKEVETLTLELIFAKESLESAHAGHLESEEQRMSAALARADDCLNWDKEIKQAQEKLRLFNEQHLQAKDLKAKLQEASSLLADLNKELAVYMDCKLNLQLESLVEDVSKEDLDDSEVFQLALTSMKKEFEDVKANVEIAKNEIMMLRVAESSLKSQLEKEKAKNVSIRQNEGMASIAVSSLKIEIDRAEEEIKRVTEKEEKIRVKMTELPKLLQLAALEAEQSKASAKMELEELRKSMEEVERVKSTLSTTEIRLKATLKVTEAARASEGLTLAAIKSLQDSDEASSVGKPSQGVALLLEEYCNLNKKAHEAEQFANERISSATAQIQAAKGFESNSLQILREACQDMDKKKEELSAAIDKANKAKEGKLGVEQELRKWRAEHEQRRRASGGGAGQSAAVSSRNQARNLNNTCESQAESIAASAVAASPGPKIYISGTKIEKTAPEFKLRKKKTFLPQMVRFLTQKRVRSRK